MRRDDEIRLRHMLDAARETMSFAEGYSRTDLDTDRKTTVSIVKGVEMVGEAASKVSKECRSKLPQIPWAEIVAMRNRLVHVYFDINLDIVWDTIAVDLPELIAVLEGIVPPEEDPR